MFFIYSYKNLPPWAIIIRKEINSFPIESKTNSLYIKGTTNYQIGLIFIKKK